jgi:hypothetical protein
VHALTREEVDRILDKISAQGMQQSDARGAALPLELRADGRQKAARELKRSSLD